MDAIPEGITVLHSGLKPLAFFEKRFKMNLKWIIFYAATDPCL